MEFVMNISRPMYLQQLINRMNNGMIKIVTGLCRCGKSYLLFELFKEYLLSEKTVQPHRSKIDEAVFEEVIYR